ncbi:immunoglobulin domain-containing protein oig-4-like [Daphnia carinata]|uniref:immunoglobulin domain-containing protein oig-4-like n=1 Tax=Daphnia carinata TaxID=120202 RepID=UPI00257CD095|nr:immunoglobulin domain-containing protein oig-4-like [Daphnia carinata]
MKSLSLRYGVIIFLLIIDRLDSAAVPKGGVGAGGRGVKGMRHKAGGRKAGERRPVLSSAGIRAGANTVVQESPTLTAVGVGGHPLGSRKTEESESYYNNPNGAKLIDASHFESEYILGRKLAFYCKAQGVPRPHITWLKDGIELYAHPFFQVHEYKVGKDLIKSKMEIDPATQKDSGFYECQADNKYAIDKRGFRTDYTLDVY